ncbi:MAG TPA: hypothetical protein VGJ55_03400 [Pyrinomonadaceae bacterium]|jgi:hypothetical protein
MIFLFCHYLPALVATTLVFFVFSPQVAQEQLLKKSFQEWSKVEVTKLLNDSAWAKTQAVRVLRRKQLRTIAGQVNVDPTTTSTVDRQAPLGGAEDALEFKFTIRLRSSLPIRQAIVRLVQLEAKYDQLPAAQKKSIDAQTRELLECKECVDNYVISVGFGSTNSQGVDLIYDWFRGQSVESLKGYIYIQNDRGERRELASFIPPRVAGDEAFFFFARLGKDGKPLITPDNKRLLFRMSDAHANSVTNFRLDVSRMVVNGRVEF